MLPEAVAHLQRMAEYNVPGGKLNRGLTVIHSLQLLQPEGLTEEEIERANVLGWCIEWLQACFLVADDLMDASVTRRGQPCWYKVEGISTIAVNDAFLLRSALFVFLKAYFSSKDYYVTLLHIFNETILQTELGQLLDLTSAPMGGPVDLSRFTIERYKKIVKYKTAFYSFYLPVAAAMIQSGIKGDALYAEVKDILCEMGEYFQVQDDYLDCYGTPEVIGKIGTDIQDNKCGWLVVQALDRATPAQRELLQTNYGRHDEECVAKVKELYKEMNIEQVFRDYEDASYASLRTRISALEAKTAGGPALGSVLEALLKKIYKRSL